MGSPPREYETSATYLQGLVRGLEIAGRLHDVRARASPDLLEMLHHPHARPWWNLERSIAFTDAVLAVGGPELVNAIGKTAVFESISRIVRPFISVLLTIGGPSPATLFARLGQLSSVAVRHVSFSWQARTDTSGTLQIDYPSEVPEAFAGYWQGAFVFLFELARRTGRSNLDAYREGRRFTFALEWAA